MTNNVRDNYYPHIRLLPTHPHLASADFIRLLPVATSAHPIAQYGDWHMVNKPTEAVMHRVTFSTVS